MTECTHIPQDKLSSYVKFIWFNDGYSPSHSRERVLPGGSSQIIINLGKDYFRHFYNDDQRQAVEYPHSIVVGVYSRYIFLDSNTRKSSMGVVLKPGGLQALFGIPGNEFLNHAVALDDIINCDVNAVRQQLIGAQTPERKFQLLASFLSGLLDNNFQPNHGIIYAAKKIKNTNTIYSVSDIADDVGYSRRRLSELFKNTVGIAPKKFARIQRFQHALKMIRQSPEPNWSQLAFSCGYYDQPHFNREFKAFSGLTPTQYFRNKTGETNHLPA